jgi:hypothetical protein
LAFRTYLLHGWFGKWREKHNVDYYSFYTEAWANRLGEKFR